MSLGIAPRQTAESHRESESATWIASELPDFEEADEDFDEEDFDDDFDDDFEEELDGEYEIEADDSPEGSTTDDDGFEEKDLREVEGEEPSDPPDAGAA